MNKKNTLWVDALDFLDYGGWKEDTQFTHLMGCGCLIACEAPGEPVSDAKTTIKIEENAMYRVWVRNRNWLFEHSPGKFKIAIDDKECDAMLGTLPSNDWVWQIAGDYNLEVGEHTLSLIDKTGYFGRCSNIIITSDMNFVPKRPVDEFEEQRASFKGISLEPVIEGEYDLIVAGGGPGGIPAAVAAARKNVRTLVLTNRSIIGGNASDECGVGFNGASARQVNAREGGIVEEIIRIKGNRKCTWTQAIDELCSKEENLTIIYDMHVCGVEKEGNRIKSLIARHTKIGTRHIYKGKMFIDATGDGWVGYYSYAQYRIGREAKWQYDEEFAPNQPDLLTMSGSLMGVRFEDTGSEVTYEAPIWAEKMPKGKAFGRNIEGVKQHWWNEAPNTYDDIYDAEITRDEIQRVLISYFDYLKNGWDEKEKAKNYRFAHMSYIDAKRESRRIIGDYVLTQSDCVNAAEFDDVIAHSGWPIDIHHPKGMYSGEEGPFFSNTHVPLVEIPYRCIYSKDIDNLMMAGRNVSVSHIALGTTRVQATIATMAQAAGTAIFMCLDKNVTPREIGEKYIKELQQILLKDDQFIPRIKNEDKNDLARGCKVYASSYEKNEKYLPYLGIEDKVLPLDRQRATFFARGVCEKIDSLYLKLENTTSEPIPLTIHLREQKDPDGYTADEDLCVMTKMVPANSESWVEYPVNVKTSMRYLWIMTDITKGLGWRIWKYPPLDWTRSERASSNEKFENMRGQTHMVSLIKPIEQLANCEPRNVINGYSRVIDQDNYCWVSDKEFKLPQWICLEYDSATTIEEVDITFDTDMNNVAMLNPIFEISPTVVTDYIVEAYTKDGWEEIANVKDNFLRKRIHKFEAKTVNKVRITVLDTKDHKQARIFEIRTY